MHFVVFQYNLSIVFKKIDMSFAPKKKASKVQTRKRHGKWLFEKSRKIANGIVLQYDADGNATGLAHFASPLTGQYKGRDVISVKTEASKIRTVRA